MEANEINAKLNVDTEDFERKLDDAISKVNTLKEALESLNELTVDIEVELIKSTQVGYLFCLLLADVKETLVSQNQSKLNASVSPKTQIKNARRKTHEKHTKRITNESTTIR